MQVKQAPNTGNEKLNQVAMLLLVQPVVALYFFTAWAYCSSLPAGTPGPFYRRWLNTPSRNMVMLALFSSPRFPVWQKNFITLLFTKEYLIVLIAFPPGLTNSQHQVGHQLHGWRKEKTQQPSWQSSLRSIRRHHLSKKVRRWRTHCTVELQAF